MSLRTAASAAFLSNLQSASVRLFTLAEFRLDAGTLYVTDLPHPVTWNGITWVSSYGVASIGEVAETAAQSSGLQFVLSGVNDALLASVLNADIQGRTCILRIASLNGSTISVDDAAWRGTLDAAAVQRSASGQTTISITAEHMLARWDRPNLVRHSHEDQQRLYPGDQFYSFAAKLTEATITWPAKEFFQK